MAEDLQIINGSKNERYASLLPQIRALVEGETDLVANLANIAAALKEQFGWLWVGFYLVRNVQSAGNTGGDRSSANGNVDQLPAHVNGDRSAPGANDEQLVVGPFQGPVACTRIRKGKGVCGASWAESRTLIVPDVEAFPGHIACSSLSRSEIVVPLFNKGVVAGVLDIDSERLNEFDEEDQHWLEQIVQVIPESQLEANRNQLDANRNQLANRGQLEFEK